MTNKKFAERIVAMMQTLYRISYSQLPQSSDREDAVQECLYKAWQKREQLKDERYMQTWVVRILINECHNIQKRNNRETPLEYLPEYVAPPDCDYELHDALIRLDEKVRLPIILYYMEGFSIKEISQIIRIPQGTVKSRMMRGRKELKKELFEEEKVICKA